MKTSTKKETHNGIQPIRVLKHNLTHRLVDRNKELIENLQSDLKLNSNIAYHIAELPLISKQKPYIDQNGLISIHETFLSYTWIITYSMFVLYEEGVAIPDQNKRGIPTHKKQNLELFELVKELFDYSKSLITSYSKWDKEYFPNPEYFDEDTEEGWYILRANDLYVEAVNFILYHEIAHAELQHINQKISKKLDETAIKKLELEADTRAIELMFLNYRNKYNTELAIIIGLASMLFSSPNLSGGNSHPDLDKRIENYLQIVKPEVESPLWAFLVIFMKLWDEQFNHNFIYKTEYNDFKELYYELLEQAK